MNQIAEIGVLRLQKVLLKDKKENPKVILNMLKSELNFLLQNYMELTDLNLDFDIVNGIYALKIDASATRIKTIGSLKN